MDSVIGPIAVAPPAMSKPQVHLDLLTARGSFLVTSTCLFLFSLNLPVFQFVTTSFLSNLGTGSTPALNSLALGLLPSKSESGRLFGALAVLHALGTTLISPILYGELFATTVGYAPTVFFVAGFMPLLALTASLFVRVHKSSAESDEERAPGDPGVQLSTGE
jgi:sugar phosphate permease